MRLTKTVLYPGIAVFLLGLIVAGISCTKDIPDRVIVYENHFDDTLHAHVRISGPAGVSDTVRTTMFNGSRVLGTFNNNLVQISATNLPVHNVVRVEFDLYIHDQWDGDHLRPGVTIPDVWKMDIDAFNVYVTTFANTGYAQSFPGNYNPASSGNPSRGDAWEVLPGYCSLKDKKDGTTHYKIDYSTAHINPDITLGLSDALQPFGDFCLKSWSVDNVRITAVNYK